MISLVGELAQGSRIPPGEKPGPRTPCVPAPAPTSDRLRVERRLATRSGRPPAVQAETVEQTLVRGLAVVGRQLVQDDRDQPRIRDRVTGAVLLPPDSPLDVPQLVGPPLERRGEAGQPGLASAAAVATSRPSRTTWTNRDWASGARACEPPSGSPGSRPRGSGRARLQRPPRQRPERARLESIGSSSYEARKGRSRRPALLPRSLGEFAGANLGEKVVEADDGRRSAGMPRGSLEAKGGRHQRGVRAVSEQLRHRLGAGVRGPPDEDDRPRSAKVTRWGRA